MRREIKPPQRNTYVELVAYTLSVVENIENKESHTYHEDITS